MTSPVQTVTVSSEGPAAEMYPDMIGQYNILRDVYFNDRAVHQHTERKDRFIMNNGSNSFWYFTDKLSAEKGFIRNISLLLNPSGDMFVPHQGWQYVNTSMQYTDLGCATVR